MDESPGPDAPEVPVTYTLRLSDEADPTQVTVVTPAFERAFKYVDAYLMRSGETGAGESGRALGIVGDLGSGKTHLSRSVLDRIGRSREDAILLYLDAPHSDFGALFRNILIEQFGKLRLHELVIDYYARLTAAQLEESVVNDEIRNGLIAGTIDPRKVVEHFHLTESVLLGELREKLRHLPEHSPYATALALMVMDELVDPVWEWLRGGAPGPELRERGLTTRLDTSADAYHTLSVLVFLASRLQRRLVLVVDEFEKLLDAPGAINAFSEIVEVFIRTSALLVFCGLPDSLTLLDRGTLHRCRVLTPTAFGSQEVILLLERRGWQIGLPIAACLVEMGDGNPREMLTLYRRALEIVREEDRGSGVSPALIRLAVRQRYEHPRDEVAANVRRVLEDSGLDFRTGVMLVSGTEPIDFWLPYGEGAVAVVVTSSLLREGDELYLRRRVEAAREVATPCELIVVVNGHLTATMRAKVSGLIGRQPLVYDMQSFTKTFRNAVDAAIRRIADSSDEGVLDGLRRQMERLSRQQTATQNMIDQLLDSMAGIRVSAAGPSPQVVAATLPATLAEQFERAAAAADATIDLTRLLDVLFDSPSGSENSLRARRRLASRELVESAGTAWVQRLLLDAFRERVADFLDATGPGRLAPEREEELRGLCRTFAVTIQALPAASVSEPAPASVLEQGVRSQLRAERARALDELGRRVLEEVRLTAPT
ncbi:hypothetical protein OIE66_36965 [Nonomuraea sp. NBC_01738]|uniref:hypothetical protein n=1 Tax=Nonomuraea sp. NBC_01738 TaxID=2976003 RepID=UPI002E1397A3|nr:hypothetical protein OIE66_36965 [Nonomuraea sp. NBC_01738]